MEQLKETESELYKTTFDHINTQYDGILSQFEHEKNMLDEYISQSEQQGFIVSTKYYNALIQTEQRNLANLKTKRDSLTSSLQNAVDSGAIVKNSEAWNEMIQEIDGVTESIEEANTALLEYDNNIRSINWEVFDFIEDRISTITTESEFLLDLLSNSDLYDERGQLTNEGLATLGLNAIDYNTYMKQADKYAEEIKKINKDLADDPYDKELIERKEELIKKQQEYISSAEDAKQAIKKLVSDGIEKELDALQDLIDKYNDAIDSQKDLYDYQKKMADYAKQISVYEKQLAAYQGDTSEEGRLKYQQAQNSLNDTKDDLYDAQYEQSLSDQKKLLDDLYDQYEEILNKRLDNLDQLVTDMINAVNSNSSTITDTITAATDKVGYTLTGEMQSILDNGNLKIVDLYKNDLTNIGSTLTSVGKTIDSINAYVSEMMKALNAKAETNVKKETTSSAAKSETVNKPSTTPNTSTTTTPSQSKTGSGNGVAEIGDKVTFVSGLYYENSYGQGKHGNWMRGQQVYITGYNPKGSHPYHISRGNKMGNGDLGWLRLDQLSGYKTGSANIPSDRYAWTQEDYKPEAIIRKSDGAVLMPLPQSSQVIKADATRNLYEFAYDPTKFIMKSLNGDAIPDSKSVQNVCNQNFKDINFNFPNVKNYDEMIQQMSRDNDFERMISALTTDKYLGKGSIRKFL